MLQGMFQAWEVTGKKLSPLSVHRAAADAAAADAAAVTNDDTSDEEREWLQAVESGDIEEYEKKKSEKNPALLTARQVSVDRWAGTGRQMSVDRWVWTGECRQVSVDRWVHRVVYSSYTTSWTVAL